MRVVLHHAGVAGHQGGRTEAERQPERGVPRQHAEDGSEREVLHVAGGGVRAQRLRCEVLLGMSGVVLGRPGRLRHLTARLGDRLAHLLGHQRGEFFGGFAHVPRHRPKHLRALSEAGLAPAAVRLVCAIDRGGDLVRAGGGHLADHLAGAGVDGGEGLGRDSHDVPPQRISAPAAALPDSDSASALPASASARASRSSTDGSRSATGVSVAPAPSWTTKSSSRVKNDSQPSSVMRMVSEMPTVLSPSTPHIHGMTWKVMPGSRTVKSPGLSERMYPSSQAGGNAMPIEYPDRVTSRAPTSLSEMIRRTIESASETVIPGPMRLLSSASASFIRSCALTRDS